MPEYLSCEVPLMRPPALERESGSMAYLRGINAFRLNPENTAADYIL